MTRNHTYPLWLALLGIAIVCLLAGAASQGWMLASAWLACCRLFQTVVSQLSWPLLIVGARGILLIILLVGFGLWMRRLWCMQQFLAELMAVTALGSSSANSLRLQQVCAPLGFTHRVLVLKTTAPLAFCFGWLVPRICVSEGLLATLTDPELRAVLLHEEYHRRHFHPLRSLLADALATLLFFLPVVAEWRNHFRIATEVAADQYAERLIGRSPLAGALHKLLTSPTTVLLPSEVSGFSATAARVARLLGDAPPPVQFSKTSLLCSSVNLIVGCVALQIALLPLFFC